MLSPYTARRRKHRIACQIRRRLEKAMAKLPECHWVLSYRYLGQTKTMAADEWHSIGSHPGLVRYAVKQTGAMNEALLESVPDQATPKPKNSVARASACRAMLRDAWLEHVKGTPYEGKVQMYKLVESGKCSPFSWWSSVVGESVPFTNDAINAPDVSSRVWDFCSQKKNIGTQ